MRTPIARFCPHLASKCHFRAVELHYFSTLGFPYLRPLNFRPPTGIDQIPARRAIYGNYGNYGHS